VAAIGFILNVRGVDCDSAFSFLGSAVDVVIGGELRAAGKGQRFGNSGRQRGFTVVNVTDCADVDVRFGSLKLLLSHFDFSFLL
jgi:hypothetical protein